MKLRKYKLTVFRRLQGDPGGDFAVLHILAHDDPEAARIVSGILANNTVDEYDWHYSPIMRYYDAELEFTKPTA